MLRDIPAAAMILFIMIIFTILTSFYYKNIQRDGSVTLGITETVRSAAIANVDNSSRLNNGELFINQQKFEEKFKEDIVRNQNIKLKGPTRYTFSYLKKNNGAMKAIRIKILDEDRIYQATSRIDISPK